MPMKSKRSKACDIPKKVKDVVWQRDGGRCIVCGCTTAMPNAHYISRKRGGLGIEQNIVTLCTEFGNGCHRKYDFGTQQERLLIGATIKAHLIRHYPGWNERELVYKK